MAKSNPVPATDKPEAKKPQLRIVKSVVPFQAHTTRPIQSVFYGRDKKVIRTNHAAHANSAVMRSVDHMQLDRYQAAVVEVFDSTTGVLHAVLRWHNQTLEVVFKRDPKAINLEERGV